MHNADVSPDAASVDALFGAVYDRLKRMAGKRLSTHGRAGTLDTTTVLARDYVQLYTAWGKPDLAQRWRARLPARLNSE